MTTSASSCVQVHTSKLTCANHQHKFTWANSHVQVNMRKSPACISLHGQIHTCKLAYANHQRARNLSFPSFTCSISYVWRPPFRLKSFPSFTCFFRMNSSLSYEVISFVWSPFLSNEVLSFVKSFSSFTYLVRKRFPHPFEVLSFVYLSLSFDALSFVSSPLFCLKSFTSFTYVVIYEVLSDVWSHLFRLKSFPSFTYLFRLTASHSFELLSSLFRLKPLFRLRSCNCISFESVCGVESVFGEAVFGIGAFGGACVCGVEDVFGECVFGMRLPAGNASAGSKTSSGNPSSLGVFRGGMRLRGRRRLLGIRLR